MSGVTRQSYVPEIRIIRLMCTGRVDLAFVLRAFEKGASGVIIGGCWPGECHYVTEGNYDALGNMYLCKKLLSHIGINPDRLRLEWISASEGARFAEVMTDFGKQIENFGRLGHNEGIEPKLLQSRLAQVAKLVPYIKLVERQRLRVPIKTEQAYQEFYQSEEASRLFDALIADKLVVEQILSLLRDKPHSTAQIANELGLKPSAVSKHMNCSSRHGLVRYDVASKCYMLA